jgi:RHS repeat-associated protein
VDAVFEHQYLIQGASSQENNTLHVMDDQSRIALVRVGAPFADDDTPAVKYQLGDHLGSTNTVTDESGTWIEREEYTPYGETSFGKFARKKYRFTGKERDEESGLFYIHLRYYVNWLGRWNSCDPVAIKTDISSYIYASNNPMNRVDPTGSQDRDLNNGSGGGPNGGDDEIDQPVRQGAQGAPGSYPNEEQGKVIWLDEVKVIGTVPQNEDQSSSWARESSQHIANAITPWAARPYKDPRLDRHPGMQMLQVGTYRQVLPQQARLGWSATAVGTGAGAGLAVLGPAAAAAGPYAVAGSATVGRQLALQFPRATAGATEFVMGEAGITIGGGVAASKVGEGVRTFNPKPERGNCYKCVAAFLDSVRSPGSTAEDYKTLRNAGEIRRVVNWLQTSEGAAVTLGPRLKAINTVEGNGFFVIFTNLVRGSPQFAEHVIVGWKIKSKFVAYDPKAGLVVDLTKSEYGQFVAYPVTSF